MVLYLIGITGFSSMQFLTSYEGNNLTIVRLRRQQLMSCVFFIISAICMLLQELKFGPIELRRNIWTIFLTVGCIFQLYTAFRLPQEIEKQNKNIYPKQNNQDTKQNRTNYLKSLIIILLTTFIFTSCANQYTINGTTNIGDFEGMTLYLKYYNNNEFRNIDSCQIQHGRIIFDGPLDSTQMVFLFQEDQSLIPLVLESGNIIITLDESQQNVTGTPLNDTLYNFIHHRLELDKQMMELEHKETKFILEGLDEVSRNRILLEESERILNETDRLMTNFIIQNSDNVLGPGVFMILTAGYPYPQMTPQINEILFRSKPYLKNSTFVKKYIESASQNSNK